MEIIRSYLFNGNAQFSWIEINKISLVKKKLERIFDGSVLDVRVGESIKGVI